MQLKEFQPLSDISSEKVSISSKGVRLAPLKMSVYTSQGHALRGNDCSSIVGVYLNLATNHSDALGIALSLCK